LKKKHPEKGEYGYIRRQKKVRARVTALLLGICLVIFISGWIYFGKRENIMTLVAILGVLPAAKWATELIMMLLQKDADADIVAQTEKIAGGLVHGYELVVTAYEGRIRLDSAVICGHELAAFTVDEKADTAFMEQHIAKILNGNALGGANVKIFRDRKKYLERITALAQHPETYREGLKWKGAPPNENETRDEAVLRVLKAISL